jgi:hypothetical protein
MKISHCVCGHDKRDHRATLGVTRYGACKVCLCDAYVKPAAIALPPPETVGVSDQSSATSAGAPGTILPAMKSPTAEESS